MIKFIFFCMLLAGSVISFGALTPHQPNSPINAIDVNSNFNHIKALMQSKNIPLNFNEFQTGSVISADQFEEEFDKVRALGIDVDALGVLFIRSVELNTAFTQMAAGASSLDDIPLTSNISFSVNEDSSYSGLINFVNNQGSNNSEIVTNPSHGSVVFGANGNFVYTPSLNYFGSDSFSYRLFDGTKFSNSSQATITVNAINDIPVANDQSLSTNEDIALNITLTGSDIEGSSLTYSIVAPPTNGALTGSGANRTYTPNSNFNGSDSFTIRVNDGTDFSITKTISLTINAVNDIPVANAESISTDEDTAINITLTGSDPEGSALTYSIVSAPTNGALTGAGANRTYTPSANYNGSDSFTFKVNDGSLDSLTKTISITVNPINDIPVANAQSLSTNEDTALNITLTGLDTEGSVLTYSIVASPTNGALTGTGVNRTYTPNLNYNGSDSFTFRVNDGTDFSITKTVSITVTAVNDAPVLTPITSFSVAHNGSYNGNLLVTDVDSSTFSAYTKTQNPTKGNLTVNASTGAFTYTSTTTAFGSDSFKVTVSDGITTSQELIVSLSVVCGSSFHQESALCLSDTRVCPIDNGAGSQTWTGSSYSTCLTTSCNSGYVSSSNNQACDLSWPTGALGNLTITSGQTFNINAGSTVDYNNITINSGGTLNILGSSGEITVIGLRGSLINNGTITGRSYTGTAQTFTKTTPLGESLSYSITQSFGGAGGAGAGLGSAGGAGGSLGYGGGGGSGGGNGYGGAGGTNGGAGGNGAGGGVGGAGMSTGGVGGSPPDQTPYSTAARHGGAGGGSGGGASWTGAYSGGGGGGGGNRGTHGVGLYIKSHGGISGSGTINLRGVDGFGGGRGGGGAYASAGGGGGGAGGTGGRLWIRTFGSFTMTTNVSGGTGGAAGSYFTAQGGNPGIAGSAGAAGSTSIIQNIP